MCRNITLYNLGPPATYSWPDLLADTSFWTPRMKNEVFRLDSTKLILEDPEASRDVALADPAVHPLVKLAVREDRDSELRTGADDARPGGEAARFEAVGK